MLEFIGGAIASAAFLVALFWPLWAPEVVGRGKHAERKLLAALAALAALGGFGVLLTEVF